MKTDISLNQYDLYNQTHFGYRRVGEKEKVRLVQDHFDTIAARYDLSNTILSFGCQLKWKRTAVAAMELRPGERVMDICGGTGDLSLRAARLVGLEGSVTLYDFNRAMIEIARGKASGVPYGNRIFFVQGDAEVVSLPDGSFDAAMVGFGIRNLARPTTGLREIFRVLKRGGRFMCLEFSRPSVSWFRRLYDFYSFRIMPPAGRLLVGSRQAYRYLPESIRIFPGPEELSEIMRQIGFERVRFKNMTGGIVTLYTAVKPRAETD